MWEDEGIAILIAFFRSRLTFQSKGWGSRFIRNVGNNLPDYVASHTRRQSSLSERGLSILFSGIFDEGYHEVLTSTADT
jgi:hypothetical protein